MPASTRCASRRAANRCSSRVSSPSVTLGLVGQFGKHGTHGFGHVLAHRLTVFDIGVQAAEVARLPAVQQVAQRQQRGGRPAAHRHPARHPKLVTSSRLVVLLPILQLGHFVLVDHLAHPDADPCTRVPSDRRRTVRARRSSGRCTTAPWKGAHQRRTLLYKYCQSHLAWSAPRVQPRETPSGAE